jgi:uncharacterized SAM-binding protein YcdF (DUF218 family)
MLVLLFIIGFILLLLGNYLWAKRVLSICFISVLFIALFPLGEWLLYPLEKKYSQNEELINVDGVIVLAGPENPILTKSWNQVSIGDSSERLLVFMMLSRQHPNAKLVFTGGGAGISSNQLKKSDVAKLLFEEQGINVSNVIFEEDSRNTWESILFSNKLLKPDLNSHWVLITSSWHLPRTMGILCKVNWQVTPYPVDYKSQSENLFRINWDFSSNLELLVIAMREWIGILAYRLTGKAC